MRHSPQLDEEFEEKICPSRFLGYNRDHLGIFLLSRDMLKQAEIQFRRAVYLNPYETVFIKHLSWCLYKQGNLEESLELINLFLKKCQGDEEGEKIRGIIKSRISGEKT